MSASIQRVGLRILAVWLIGVVATFARPAEDADVQAVHPAAILEFEERGAGPRGLGPMASDLLFAALVGDPALFLVDRQDMEKVLDEHALSLSGAVEPGQAVRIGQLTGARILITGSVIEAGSSVYLVARIIGTETSRVLGASVKGRAGDELGPLAENLADKVASTIHSRADQLVAKQVKTEDRIAALNKVLGDAERPVVTVQVDEAHVGQVVIDPAAETELVLFCRETGFDVRDRASGRRDVDIVLEGEGFSEFAMRRGNLVSVKARLEVKAVERDTGRILAVERATTVAVDLTELIAGKTALQKAAAEIAERLLPKLVE